MSILDNPQAQSYSVPEPHTSDLPKQDTIFGLNGSPKTMFILGLASGIGAMALIALIGIMTLLLNGTGLNVAKAATGQVAANNQPQADANLPNDGTATDTAPVAGPLPAVTKADHTKGKDSAKITIVEYSDFQCPYCQKHEASIEQALKDFPNDVRVVYRYFPLSSIHPFAQKSAEAAECGAKQGKFWEMHDQLFALGASSAGLSIDGMKKIAADLKLDTNAFNKCLDNDETKSIVDQQYQDGATAGVSGTPANFINGKLVEGAVPYDQFKASLTAAGAKN
jgi:protein-disulfide isomerase